MDKHETSTRPLDLLVSLRWSKEPPQEPGWYWTKGWNGVGCVEVFMRPGHNYLAIMDPAVCAHTKRNFLPVVNLGAEWAGPIQIPEAS